MTMNRRDFLAGSMLSFGRTHILGEMDDSPAPFGALPSSRQLNWQRMETNAFLHFTVNTFTDKEWGDEDEDPAIFNPQGFDADCNRGLALKAGGMKRRDPYLQASRRILSCGPQKQLTTA